VNFTLGAPAGVLDCLQKPLLSASAKTSSAERRETGPLLQKDLRSSRVAHRLLHTVGRLAAACALERKEDEEAAGARG
jgi:hypothetical protein